MSGSISLLDEWMDQSFWTQGAFMTSPDEEWVILGKGGERGITEVMIEGDHPVFYLKDFFQNSFVTYTPTHTLKVSRGHLVNWLQEKSIPDAHFSPVSNDDDLYQKDFLTLKHHLKNNLEKVVLISRESFEAFEGESSIKLLFKKAFLFGAGLPYGIWDKHTGMMGSTPEVLFEIKDDELQTFALAGTSKKGLESELLHSKKDLHEHNLVIRDIVEKISSFTQDVKVFTTEIYPFKNLIHLKTQILGKIHSTNYTDLICTLSPTAALGGYPKKESKEFLLGSSYFDKYPVRYFGSAFGVMTKETKAFLVAIRNVQWKESELFIESGGGVVSESDFSKELEEIHLKRNTIRKHYL